MACQCSNTSVAGLVAIPDMGASDTYMGVLGRLYESGGLGTNAIPAGHAADLATAAAAIEKLNSAGSPAPTGKIGVLSISMSNGNQKFAEFMRVVPDRNSAVILVNGAQPNKDAPVWADNTNAVWTEVESRLSNKGINANQVQVVWIEQAIAGASGDFTTHRDELVGYYKDIVLNCTERYPNLQIIFWSPRTYGGYTTLTSQEPYAYETGFATREIIRLQYTAGDPDIAVGASYSGNTVPAMAWATYLDGGNWKGAYWWCNGTTANGQGTVANCTDYEADCLHPAGDDDGVAAPNGMEHKCAALLKLFFENSPYTSTWWTPPLTPTLLDNYSSNVAASSFTGNAFTPTAETFILVIYMSRAGVAATPNQPTCTGHAITWTHEERRVFSTEAAPRSQVGALYGISGSSPGSAAVTLDFGGQSQSVCNIIVVEFPNVYAAAGAVVQSTGYSEDSVNSLSFALAAETSEAIMVSAFANIEGASFDPRAGWTELAEAEPASAPLGLLQVQYLAEYDSTASAARSGAGNMHIGGIAIGLRRPPPRYLLEVTISGSAGSVSSSPSGIDCGADCSEEYYEDTVITLTAAAPYGYLFTEWQGDYDTAVAAVATVTMDVAKSIVAVFTPIPRTVFPVGRQPGTHYQDKSLSIQVYYPLAMGNIQLTDIESTQIAGYSHERAAVGGYISAAIQINATQDEIEDWVRDGIGRHIEVYNSAMNVIWEGFVNQVDAALGPLSVTRGPLMDTTNYTYAVYQTKTYDPLGITIGGQQANTDVASKPISIARYGRLETVLSAGSDMTEAQAEQHRDTFLEENNEPKTNLSLSTSANPPSLTLSCLGYIHFLDRFYYAETTAGSTTQTAREKLLAVLAASPNTFFSTDYSRVAANSFSVPEVDGEDRTGLTVIKEVVSLGDSANDRYIFGFISDRRAYYNAVPTTPFYQIKISNPVLQLERLSDLLIMDPWDIEPGQWIFIGDFMTGETGYYDGADLHEDPRYIFIESVSFSLPNDLSINGGRTERLPQLLAKKGLGAM